MISKPRPLSVVMVIQTFYPFIGGAETQCLHLSQALQKRGVKVKVFTERWKGLKGYEVIDGVEVKRLGRGGPRWFHSIFFMVSTFSYLLARSDTYDVIHVHLAASHAVAAALFGKIIRKKVIILVGGGTVVGEIATSKNTFKGRLKLRALGLLRAPFVLLNNDQSLDLIGFGLEKIPVVIIPNGVNTDIFHPAAPDEKKQLRSKLGWNGFIFLYTGRFSNDKIILPVLENFLNAWTKVMHKKNGFSFYLVGRGPLENEYLDAIKRFNLQESIHLLVARKNVRELYKAADVFVLPSLREGLSNSLLEAMASELPILASKVPGITDIVEENTHGLLFDPFSPQDIEKCLLQIVQKTELFREMGKHSRMAAVSKYSMDKAVETYLRLYSGGSLHQ